MEVMSKRKQRSRLIITQIGLIAVALLFLSPFYFVLVNSVKPLRDILVNAASLPEFMKWENYKNAWDVLNFPRMFKNTLLITVFGNIGIILISALAAYQLTRVQTRFNRLVLSLFIGAMVIPFQTIMIPLVKVAARINLTNSLTGVILCYLGLGVSFAIFLYQGFVRSIPLEIEEAARVDGCSSYGVFWRIVFPLLKSMTVTLVLLNSFWIWNDFLLPNIILQNPALRTIQIGINSLFGQYNNQWDLALAALVMSFVPILIFFLIMQRQIIEGISSGAVKG